MNTQRRRTLIRLTKKLEGIKEELNQVCQEEQLALDNLPANLSLHGKADAMKSVIDSLDGADYSLEDVITYLNDAINEEVEYREMGEPLFERVAEYIINNNDASITHIKRDFHIGQERARNIIWRLISADVLEGIVYDSPKKVTVKVHDLEMLKEKLDIYNRCEKLYEAFKAKYPHIDVRQPRHNVAISVNINDIILSISLLPEKKWWYCEAKKFAKNMGDSIVCKPFDYSAKVLNEFTEIFKIVDDKHMRKDFFATYDDAIICFKNAYERFMSVENLK